MNQLSLFYTYYSIGGIFAFFHIIYSGFGYIHDIRCHKDRKRAALKQYVISIINCFLAWPLFTNQFYSWYYSIKENIKCEFNQNSTKTSLD